MKYMNPKVATSIVPKTEFFAYNNLYCDQKLFIEEQ